MILVLYGKDQYRLKRKINDVIESYKKNQKGSFSLKIFNLKEEEFSDFQREYQSTPIFKEHKLIIFENTSSNQEFKEKFIKEIKKFAELKDMTILFKEGDDISKDKFFISLKKWAKFQEADPLEGEKLKIWIEKEFGKYETEIEKPALEKLIEFTGNNLWQIENEVKKLVSYKNGGTVNLKDVINLVKPKIDSDIFKTIDAIAQRNKKLALKLIHKHIERGDSPSYIFSMINFQFRNLLMVKSQIEKRTYFQKINDLSKDLGIHPYVVSKTISQTKKFSFEELKKIYKKIFKTDLYIKTGKIEPQVALDLFIAEI